jgi:hypothetical protein
MEKIALTKENIDVIIGKIKSFKEGKTFIMVDVCPESLKILKFWNPDKNIKREIKDVKKSTSEESGDVSIVVFLDETKTMRTGLVIECGESNYVIFKENYLMLHDDKSPTIGFFDRSVWSIEDNKLIKK